jgi:hypothetical protein
VITGFVVNQTIGIFWINLHQPHRAVGDFCPWDFFQSMIKTFEKEESDYDKFHTMPVGAANPKMQEEPPNDPK